MRAACVRSAKLTQRTTSTAQTTPYFGAGTGPAAKEYNRVQVFGKAHLGEAFDWEEVGEVFERLLQVHDLNMDTTQKALDRARSEMRRQAHDALGGEIVVPVNCGQELYDVIEVNDASSGLSTARRRVMGLELRYSRLDRPEYVHVLTLGGV